jgi:L-threonylcarbamoyladenylate synthase
MKSSTVASTPDVVVTSQQQCDKNNVFMPHQHNSHNHKDNGNHNHKIHTQAKMVSPSMIQDCGERLRNGDLVAFPTETVYGLGCNALDEQAIIKVFHAKERPLTDPLISHVADPATAYQLWNATSSCSIRSLEAQAIVALTQQFWPGPLTIVAEAAAHVPAILMAHTGYCACRSPNHPLALQLIQAANVPIAAPSANKFGHVSPTTAQHVWDDLLHENVWILRHDNHNKNDVDDDKNKNYDDNNKDKNDPTTPTTTTATNTVSCEIGVESSVVKIEMTSSTSIKELDDHLMMTTKGAVMVFRPEAVPLQDTVTTTKGTITLLRQGAVSTQDICNCLQSRGLLQYFDVITNTQKATNDEVSHVSPGQTIRHYSPHIPSYMVSRSLYLSTTASDMEECDATTITTSVAGKSAPSRWRLSSAVVIDFGGMLKEWQPLCLAYHDLSPNGDSAQATQQVFDILRWAEQVDTATSIFFPKLEETQDETILESQTPIVVDALTLALKDRLTRAASGVVLQSFDDIL